MRAIAIALLFAACSSAESTSEPTLTITAPGRGTMASGPVTVTGSVTNAAQVFVNGAQVTPAADGTFSTTVTFDPGIGIIETHAINGASDIKDVRAVLAGNTAPTDGSVKSPLAAHASVTALKSIGAAMATEAKAIDYTAAAQAMNPVYNNTGCLGAKIDISSIDLSNIGVGLTPAANTIGTDVTISNVVVKLHADFKVACIGGSTTITVKSSAAHLHGALGVTVAGKALATSVGAVTVTLDNFSMDVGGVPGAIEDLFNGVVRGKVEDALTSMIHDNVPALANHALAGLVAKPLSVNVLGKMTAWTAVPTKASIAADGLTVAVDTTVKVTDGTGSMALAQPTPVNDDMVSQATGIGLALATDAINQMFGGLWAAGALDKTMPMSSLGALGAVLDSNATNVTIKMMLPPTVTTGTDGLSLAIGDLILTTTDDAGNAVQTFALSVKTTLAANPSQLGKLLLTLGTPEIHAQIIAQSDVVTRPLTDDLVTGIVQSVWTLVGGTVDDAMSNLPMPAFAGIQLGAPAIKGTAGFVLADIAVQ